LFHNGKEVTDRHSTVSVKGFADRLAFIASDFRILERNRSVISEKIESGTKARRDAFINEEKLRAVERETGRLAYVFLHWVAIDE